MGVRYRKASIICRYLTKMPLYRHFLLLKCILDVGMKGGEGWNAFPGFFQISVEPGRFIQDKKFGTILQSGDTTASPL